MATICLPYLLFSGNRNAPRKAASFDSRRLTALTPSGQPWRAVHVAPLRCPLLANLYLDALDWRVANDGHEMVRYADDIVVLCRTEKEAAQVMESVREWMAGAGLTLHPEKTRTVDMSQSDACFDFLGYRFKRTKRGRLMRLMRPKSLSQLRESLKPQTRRTDGRSLRAIAAAVKTRPCADGMPVFGMFIPAPCVKWTDGCGCACVPCCASDKAAKAGEEGPTSRAGPTNRYFTELGRLCLEATPQAELIRLRHGAPH